MTYYEIPIAIQDRSFNADGSLFYPDNRAFFEGLHTGQLQIPFIPQPACTGPSDVSPIWNPEFFGNTIVVNGRTWPYLDVEQRRYRFRFLNGCDSRFLILKLSRAGLPFWQIGADGGFLPAPVRLDQLLMGPAERADVIVDFTDVPAGTEIVLLNLRPRRAVRRRRAGRRFRRRGSGAPPEWSCSSASVPARSTDLSTPPEALVLPQPSACAARRRNRPASVAQRGGVADGPAWMAIPATATGNISQRISSWRATIRTAVPFGPTMALLGTVDARTARAIRCGWMDAITENPAPGATEVWEIHNFTADAHPIHIHDGPIRSRRPRGRAGRRPAAGSVGDEAPRTPSSPTPARSRG